MIQVLSRLGSSVAFGDIQVHSNLTIQPIIHREEPRVNYMPMADAISSGVLSITEINEGGSVPELMAENTGKKVILIMDGEELVGAKQNRVLNTTVFLPGQFRTVLPVSCVEQGRWHSVSDKFTGSENMLISSMRARKHHHVSANLAEDGSRRSDQHEIWQDVAEMTNRCEASESPTGAMSDVFRHRDRDLNEMTESFTLEQAQVGMAIFINGELAGIEYLSQPRVFAAVFSKLLRSYALDALIDKKSHTDAIDIQIAPGILDAINSAEIKSYKAVGLGDEHRISNGDVLGSAITTNDEVLHLSLISAKRKHDLTETPVPFPRSYWVESGRLLAGCYPGDSNQTEARRKLSALLDSGIRAIVNLTEENELGHNGKPFVQYQDTIIQMGIERGLPVITLRKPVRDLSVPTHKYMREILDQIDGLLAMGTPVYVHCWGGRGRTGTVVGCWLARHGIVRGDRMIEYIEHLRRNDPTVHKPSPQTPAQMKMICSWGEGE